MQEFHEIVPVHKEIEVRGELSVQEVSRRMTMIEELQKAHMKKDLDYGVIPGTGGKPTLFKPGAEKLCVMFQMGSRPPALTQTFDGDHLTVTAMVTLFHIPTGTEIGTGTAIATTKEKKYAYRESKRKCPACKKETIYKSKEEWGGGWYCNKKAGGCGAKFSDPATDITNQTVGIIPNPDLPDEWNTVIKMAVKRAKLDATLSATGASAYFTQDLEDFATPQEEEPKPAAKPVQQPKPVAASPPQQKPQEVKSTNGQDPKRFDVWKATAKKTLGYDDLGCMKLLEKITGKPNPMHITDTDIFNAITDVVKNPAKYKPVEEPV
jgi:hypothetical protein